MAAAVSLFSVSLDAAASRRSSEPTSPPVEESARVRPVDGHRDEGRLSRDVARVERAWSLSGAAVREAPRLLRRGQTRPLIVPPEALAPGSGCASVAVIAARNVSFVLLVGSESPARRSWPIASRAGVAEVTRCGPRKVLLEGMSVQMRSPRGLLETLVAVSKEPLPLAVEVLPSREVGPSGQTPSLGRRPALDPAALRAERFELRARREGAVRVVRVASRADRAGQGAAPLRLEVGCHRLDVLADSDSTGGADIDAQVLDLGTDEELAKDEGESGQATLRLCVGQPTRVRLAYLGAPSDAKVLVMVGSWPLPAALPAFWGAQARARLADALGKDARSSLGEGPVYTSLGVQGATRLPVELAPGACYVAAVASMRGAPGSFALGVQAGAVRRENHAPVGRSGVALSFCSPVRSRGQLEVQATGYGLAWVLGVWQTAPAQLTELGAAEGTEP